ncbi:MAG: hypothetical protein U0174_07555 [Polyangiaceae bacterium]
MRDDGAFALMKHNAPPTAEGEVHREYLYDLAPKGRPVPLDCAEHAVSTSK